MIEALKFFQQYEAVLYFVLGIGAFIYGVLFVQSWGAMRGSMYGLEQISAQRKLNQNASALIVILMMGVSVFSLVTFVGPNIIGVDGVYPTGEAPAEDEMTESDATEETILPTVEISTAGCVPGEIEISSPLQGETLSGEVTISGTVNVSDFGFYKVEIARAEENLWLTIQAGRQLVEDGDLIPTWDTSLLPPGEYVLQLSVTDNDGNEFSPCRIPIRVSASE